MVHVPFKAAPAAHQEMLAGRLDVMLDNLSAAKHHVQAGRLKALAVSSAGRSPQLDGVPTLNETGLLSFEGESWFALFAPAGTLGPVLATLRSALAGINRDAAFAAGWSATAAGCWRSRPRGTSSSCTKKSSAGRALSPAT